MDTIDFTKYFLVGVVFAGGYKTYTYISMFKQRVGMTVFVDTPRNGLTRVKVVSVSDRGQTLSEIQSSGRLGFDIRKLKPIMGTEHVSAVEFLNWQKQCSERTLAQARVVIERRKLEAEIKSLEERLSRLRNEAMGANHTDDAYIF